MKKNGFTLIELLVVIAIIGILAGMTFPVVVKAKSKAKVHMAKVEMSNIIGAVSQYMESYGRYPVSKETTQKVVVNSVLFDFTFGLTGAQPPNGMPEYSAALCFGMPSSNYQTNNAEVIAILRDVEYYGDGRQTPNYKHQLNKRKEVFLNVKDSSKIGAPSSVDPAGVLRDPWGNPYFISLDTSYDDYTVDWMYGLAKVTANPSNMQMGTQGLIHVPDYTLPSSPNTFGVRSGVMVWSMGPDGKADPTIAASSGVNKDNVLSWK